MKVIIKQKLAVGVSADAKIASDISNQILVQKSLGYLDIDIFNNNQLTQMQTTHQSNVRYFENQPNRSNLQSLIVTTLVFPVEYENSINGFKTTIP